MKRLFSFLLAAILLLSAVPISTSAACVSSSQVGTDLPATNSGHQAYDVYTKPIASYMSVQPDGKILTISKTTNGILDINYYTSAYKLVKNKRLFLELPSFGGVYETDKHFFVVTGQNNLEETDDKEVIRVTCYDKSWNRLTHVTIPSYNTTKPFVGGTVRFAYDGKILYVRTCHEMYASKNDGKNHQANITFSIDTETMQLIYSMDAVANLSVGYVSHSFNQFIRYDDGLLTALDHGDGYPRAICLVRYTTSSFKNSSGSGLRVFENINIIEMPGAIGENRTDVTVGAYDVSNSGYLVAGTTKIGKPTYNVFLAYVPDDLSSKKIYTLTNSGSLNYTTPHLVKISGNAFLVMWGDSNGKTIYYQQVNARGEKVGGQYTTSGNLSDCVPIVADGKVMWYTYSHNDVTFYQISTSTLKATKKTVNHGHKYTYGSNKSEHWQVCADCGKKTGTSKHTHFTTSFNDSGHLVIKCTDCQYVKSTKKISYLITETVKDTGAQSLNLRLTADGKTLQNNVDYLRTVTAASSTYVNWHSFYTKITMSFQVPDINNGLSSYSKTFYRLPNYVSAASIPNQVYTGKAVTPDVTLKTTDGKTLKKGTDYTLSYKNNKKKGTATVIVTGKGSYFGTLSKTFKITTGLSSAKVSGISNKAYTGKAITQSPKVKLGSKTLYKGIDYTLSYKNNTKKGTATLIIRGTGNYAGTIKKTFKILTDVSSAKVTGLETKSYTGKALTQSPKVVVGGKTLKKGTDYTLSYKNNKKVGKATVTIKGKGKYIGSLSKTFVIRTKKMGAPTLSSAKKGVVQVKWKKDSAASGYEIVYSADSGFKNKKTVNSTSTAVKLSGLRSGKTYYVKIRSKAKIGGKTYYGSYSTVKKIRVK